MMRRHEGDTDGKGAGRRPPASNALRHLVVAIVVLAGMAMSLGPGSPAGAVIDNPDLDSVGHYTYRVDPEGGEIQVTIELSLTADKPNRSTSSGYYQYYFDGILLLVPADVGDLTVTDGSGRSLTHEIVDSLDEEADDLAISFRRNLFYRQTTEVVVAFTLPGGDARSDDLARVNGAYAGFQAWVDPRLEEATVTVVAPAGFTDRSTGSDPFDPPSGHLDDEGESVLEFVADDVDPEFYWTGVSLTRDEELVETDIDVDGLAVEIESWPGDDEWRRFVTDIVETGLPELVDLVGLDWPLDRELTIVESYTPYFHGYAGWYDLETDEIEMGDELDTHVMFHELTHVWFNGELFKGRWITEGLADEFGAAAAEAMGEDRPDPPRVRRRDPVAEPLIRWDSYTVDVELEEWAYGASWTVTSALADEVGLDGLSFAVQAAAADEISYRGDGPAETTDRIDDWRRYLDLLTNQDGVDEEVVLDLFEEWVLSDFESGRLEERAESRAVYADLQEAGDTWAPPLAVRSAMSRWRFDRADEMMLSAAAVLADRDRAVDTLAPLDAALPASLEAGYETAVDKGELTDTGRLMTEAVEVADQLVDTDGNVAAATGTLQRIGAIGRDHRAELATAIDRFERGDLDDAADRAEAIDTDVAELADRGLLRVGVTVGVLVVLALLAFWLIRRRPRRRPRRPRRHPDPNLGSEG